MNYQFEWNPNKAKSNQKKHKVSFEQASNVFRDPNALSIYDEEHSDDEERWITLGLSAEGKLLVVSHTWHQINQNDVIIRIISSRKASKREQRQYKEGL